MGINSTFKRETDREKGELGFEIWKGKERKWRMKEERRGDGGKWLGIEREGREMRGHAGVSLILPTENARVKQLILKRPREYGC